MVAFTVCSFASGLNSFYSAQVNKQSALRSALLRWERGKDENLWSLQESTSRLQFDSAEAKYYEEPKLHSQTLHLLLILDDGVCQTTCQSGSNYQVTDLTHISESSTSWVILLL